ncbi:hypothetical protein LZ31DRAFT_29619 [Colletotrichum somersetense]|nr:hypothetical protein LZ31DRAFT_29619 [Colletotrichum somersetense]
MGTPSNQAVPASSYFLQQSHYAFHYLPLIQIPMQTRSTFFFFFFSLLLNLSIISCMFALDNLLKVLKGAGNKSTNNQLPSRSCLSDTSNDASQLSNQSIVACGDKRHAK